MVDIQGATLKNYKTYLAERVASTTGVSMVPGLSPDGTSVVALEEDAFKINRTTEGNFWTVGPDAPFIHRMRDRVFIGNAVGMGPTRSNTNTTWVPDAPTGANWIPRDSQFISMSDNGTIAIAGGSRASDNVGIVGGAASIASAAFSINDAATFQATWAFYADLQHEPGAGGGNSYGIEIAAKNKGTDTASNPYDRASGVYGVWLAGGGDDTYGGDPTFPANVGIMFLKSHNDLTSGWNVGINFDDESLTYDGNSLAPAIRMAKGHCIEWWTPEGTKGVYIHSEVDDDANAVQMLFNDNSVSFVGVNSKNMALFSHIASGVNYINFSNAATGNLPAIAAAGDDTNVGLSLSPKGTGAVFIASGSGATRFRANNTGIGFYTTTPVALQTGVAVTAGGIHAALVNLGLITA